MSRKLCSTCGWCVHNEATDVHVSRQAETQAVYDAYYLCDWEPPAWPITVLKWVLKRHASDRWVSKQAVDCEDSRLPDCPTWKEKTSGTESLS